MMQLGTTHLYVVVNGRDLPTENTVRRAKKEQLRRRVEGGGWGGTNYGGPKMYYGSHLFFFLPFCWHDYL